jgi:hypothetical protein
MSDPIWSAMGAVIGTSELPVGLESGARFGRPQLSCGGRTDASCLVSSAEI